MSRKLLCKLRGHLAQMVYAGPNGETAPRCVRCGQWLGEDEA